MVDGDEPVTGPPLRSRQEQAHGFGAQVAPPANRRTTATSTGRSSEQTLTHDTEVTILGLASLTPDVRQAIKLLAREAVEDLLEERLDARMASLRSDILEQVHTDMNRIREQVNEPAKEPFRTTPVLLTSRAQDLATRETVETYPRMSTEVPSDLRAALNRTRLQQRLDQQKMSSLSQQVNSLLEKEKFGTTTSVGPDRPAVGTSTHQNLFDNHIPEDPYAPPTAGHPSFQHDHSRFTLPLGPRPSLSTPYPLRPSTSSVLGPPHFGLEEIRPANPDFKDVVSYRRYRLNNTSAETGTSVSRYVGHFVKTFSPTLDSRKFDGVNSIAILDFLSAFKRVCNDHDVSEGLALLILPHFLRDDARRLIEESFELSGEGLGGYSTWPEAIQLLLMNYAKDIYIKEAVDNFRTCQMRDDEDEQAYGRRLRNLARLCGGVISSQQLVTRFCDGLPPYIRPMIEEVVPHLPSFNTFQACVDRAATIGATQRAVLSRASNSHKSSRQDRPKTTRVHQVGFPSPPYRDISIPHASQAPVLQIGIGEDNAPSEATDSTDLSFQTAANVLCHPNHSPNTEGNAIGVSPSSFRRYPQGIPRPPQKDLPSDVCFNCYAIGHRAPNCIEAHRPKHDPHLQRRMYDNYMKLTPQQKEFLRAVGRAPIILGDPSSPQGHVTNSQTATDS